MKRLLFLTFIGLLIGTWLFQQVEQGSGYILISLGQTSVEMSFWTGVGLFLFVCLLIYLIVRVTRGSAYLLATGTQRVLSGDSRAVQRRTTRGLIDFIEGNWKQARKHLLKSAKKAENPIINYLAAARSSFELGDHEEAFDLAHKAEKSAPDSELAVSLTQARMLLSGKKYERAIANLERAKKIAPHHPVVLDLMQQVMVMLEDWRGLKKLLPDLRRYHVLSEEAVAQLELKLYKALLEQAGERAHRVGDGDLTSIVKAEWEAIPAKTRRDQMLVEAYARQLIKVGDQGSAEALLRRELAKNWGEALIILFGRVEGRDTKKQLLAAEHWLQERPGNAPLLLTLGRLSLRNLDWSKAREYFESSLKLQKNPETCAELARLLAHLGEHRQSTEYYQMGLALTTAALPELPMPSPAPVQVAAKG